MSSQPPSGVPSTITWGTVQWPVSSAILARASQSSRRMKISRKATPFFSSSRFARVQYEHGSLV